jgi:hypothetical protein
MSELTNSRAQKTSSRNNYCIVLRHDAGASVLILCLCILIPFHIYHIYHISSQLRLKHQNSSLIKPTHNPHALTTIPHNRTTTAKLPPIIFI